MSRKLMLLVVVILAILPFTAEAQFGKNKVVWENPEKLYYQTEHFDFYIVGIDVSDESARQILNDKIAHIENSYVWLSKLMGVEFRERMPVVIYRTHSLFEANHIESEFMPEGVGAFAEPTRNRLVLKLDFLPPLQKTIATHELKHIFQFYLMKMGFAEKRLRAFTMPDQWIIEGGADYFASKYAPYTRDDIRGYQQRIAGGNPEKYLPTLKQLSKGEANPYSMGSMVFMFLEAKFGYDTAVQFMARSLKGGADTMWLLRELTNGQITSPEVFDRMHRDYWASIYAKDMLEKPRPYQETENFKGESLTPQKVFYPILSPVPSPDGKEIACFTVRNNGISLVVITLRDIKAEEKKLDEKNPKGVKTYVLEDLSNVRNLTRQLPPKDFEYVISQKYDTWPFNGSDLAWSPDGKSIAFFARKNRDHALFVVDSQDGKILREIEIPLDQAFSPSFSPDGKTIYFSASRNLQRDIFSVNPWDFDKKTYVIRYETNSHKFATAPVVSPDGKTLVYIDFAGDYQKLFSINIGTYERTQLTFGRSNEDAPSFSSDGKTLVYTSDEANGVWNIYTMDLETKIVRQWTDFFGGAFMPHFFPGTSDKVAYSAYWQYDQAESTIYPNFELYQAELKKPLREYKAEDKGESQVYAFNREDVLIRHLDKNQLLNPQKLPRKWKLSGGTAAFGWSSYFGGGGYTRLSVSDMLENHFYLVGLAMNGKYVRLLDFGYFNQEKRLAWGYSAYDHLLPFGYLFYTSSGSPKQSIVNNTLNEEMGVSIFGQYPTSKFSRIEAGINAENRSYKFFFDENQIFEGSDGDVLNFLKGSRGHSMRFFSAYVRDTVLYSQAVQGPWHGNALRVQLEYAPPLPGDFSSFANLRFDARRYQRLTRGMVVALRVAGLYGNNPSGDLILVGSPTLRGYPNGAMGGNQVLYANAEFRFPLLDAMIFPRGVGIGPLRGLLFVDYGMARFNDQAAPQQRGSSYGFGFQYLPFNFVWARRNTDGYHNWKFDLYLAWNY